MCTPLELKWIANKDQLYSRDNCSMSCGSLEGKGVWGRRKHVYVYLSHLLSTWNFTTLLIGYPPIENKKETRAGLVGGFNTFHFSLLSNSNSGSSQHALWYTLSFYQKTSSKYRFLTSKSTLDEALQSHFLSTFARTDPRYSAVPAMTGNFMPPSGFARYSPSTWNVLHFSIKIQLIFKNLPYVPPPLKCSLDHPMGTNRSHCTVG